MPRKNARLRDGLTATVGAIALSAGAAHAAARPLPASLPFDGAGNVVVFDDTAGTGGWVGSITEFSDPASPVANPWSFASVVTFAYDAASNLLSGHFELTDASDLSGSLFGSISGGFSDPARTLATGGQLALDYAVEGGTGTLSGYTGFGLSFLTYDPSSTAFDNYSESGVIVATVPEPATAWLLAAGLAVVGLSRRTRRS